MGETYSETTDSGTDMPQVAGADHPGFSKTTQHAANTNVQEVLNAVEVKTLEIIKKSMLGETVDPDDHTSSNDQSGDQTGRDSSASVLNRIRSSEFRKSHSKSRARKDQSKIVKTTPQKTRFRDVNMQEFGIQIEWTMTGLNRTTTS